MLDLIDVPPEEDSEDLTDEEIAGALETTDSNHFVKLFEELLRPAVRPNVTGVVQSYQLRRRKPHLYCRATLGFSGEPDKVVIFRVDWLIAG